jgi:hypothetical protein
MKRREFITLLGGVAIIPDYAALMFSSFISRSYFA